MRVKIFSYNIHGLPFLPDSWTEPLYDWFSDCDYDFICIQEAFTPARVEGLTKSLTKCGYTVVKPNDFAKRKNLLSSGLITAVKADTWKVLKEGFVKYDDCIGAEHLANKGFHWLELENLKDKSNLIVINTHLQADNPFNWFVGCVDTRPTRKKQMEQILMYLHNAPSYRSLIVGDLNAEIESHESIVYLTGKKFGINKHTFEPTGEDLDHIAIVPDLWLAFDPPKISEVSVLSRCWWSDHWPLHVCMSW